MARTLTRPLVLVVVAFMGLVSAWLPFLDSRIMARWFEGGNFWWLSPVPLAALLNAFWLWRAAMREGRDACADRPPNGAALEGEGVGLHLLTSPLGERHRGIG